MAHSAIMPDKDTSDPSRRSTKINRPSSWSHGPARRGSSAGWPAGQASQSRLDLTPCAIRSSPPLWTRLCRCGMSRKRPRTPTQEQPCHRTGAGSPRTGTPTYVVSRSSPAPGRSTTTFWRRPASTAPTARSAGSIGAESGVDRGTWVSGLRHPSAEGAPFGTPTPTASVTMLKGQD